MAYPLVVAPAAVAAGGALLLVVAGLATARNRGALLAVLHAQDTVPLRVRPTLTTALGWGEPAVGGAVLAALLLRPHWATLPLVAQSVAYTAFTGYLWRLRRYRPQAPCGCFGADARPAGRAVLVRAALLAVASASCLPVAGALAGLGMSARLLVLPGGMLVAMVGWLLPELAG